MTEVASARDVIATADVEFLHGVPVHPGLAGADAILAALREAGYVVVDADVKLAEVRPPERAHIEDTSMEDRDMDTGMLWSIMDEALYLADGLAELYDFDGESCEDYDGLCGHQICAECGCLERKRRIFRGATAILAARRDAESALREPHAIQSAEEGATR